MEDEFEQSDQPLRRYDGGQRESGEWTADIEISSGGVLEQLDRALATAQSSNAATMEAAIEMLEKILASMREDEN